MKYSYKVNDEGQAINLGFVPDDHIAVDGEIVIEGNELPDIEDLHTQGFKNKVKADKDKKDNYLNQDPSTLTVTKRLERIEYILGLN
jgi:hypothetical protein